MHSAIIAGRSAYEYHATPSMLRDHVIPLELALQAPPAGPGLAAALFRERTNLNPTERSLSERILSDLKGLHPPIDVWVEDGTCRRASPLMHPRPMPAWLKAADIIDIGGGLSVASPLTAIASDAARIGVVDTALRLFEVMGIHTIHRASTSSSFILGELQRAGLLSPEAHAGSPAAVYAYSDARGHLESFLDHDDQPLEDAVAFDRMGKPTDLWKRPPLVLPDELELFLSSHRRYHGATVLRAASRFALPGSGSPLESMAAMLLFGPRDLGGEGIPTPNLNRRIEHDPDAQRISGSSSSVGDQVWDGHKAVVEINGFAHHADKQGFFLKSGRTAALRSMGYSVLELNYEQLSDLDVLNAMVDTLARDLGWGRPHPSRAFRQRQRCLHKQLFCHKRHH